MIDPRKILVDGLLFWLTALLALDQLAWLSERTGLTNFVFTEEMFIARAGPCGLALAGLFLTAVIGAVVADRRHLNTIGRAVFSPRPPGRRAWTWHALAIFTLTFCLSLRVTEASWRELLDPGGLAGAARLWSGLTHPNFGVLAKAVALTLQTALIAFLATVLAMPLAAALAFVAAQNLTAGFGTRLTYYLVRFGLNVARSVEPLIWALVFTVWVGVGPFAGMLALLVHSVASLTKYYSEIIESVDEGPLDAIRATGARPFQVIWFAVLPQVTLPFIAMTIYRWDTNVRMATVIGLVGGGGIGSLLIQYQGQAMWPEVGCIVLVVAVVVWLLDLTSAQLRETLK